MKKSPSPLKIGFVALFGAFVGIGFLLMPKSFPLPDFILARRRTTLPSAHSVPRFPEQTTLRYGMIHDLMVGKDFPHSEAWWQETLRVYESSALKIRDDSLEADSKTHEAVELTAEAYDKLHRSREAVELLRAQRRRLAAQESSVVSALPKWAELDWILIRTAQERFAGLSPDQERVYRCWANLGTFLVHSSFAAARRGDKQAEADLIEGLRLVERSVILNPMAHFGREIWQIVFIRHFLASLRDPALLLEFSGVGLPIKAGFAEVSERAGTIAVPPILEGLLKRFLSDADSAFKPIDSDDHSSIFSALRRIEQSQAWEDFDRSDLYHKRAKANLSGVALPSCNYNVDWLVENSTKDLTLARCAPFLLNRVGGNRDWNARTKNIVPNPVPFDEPCLAMLGMWTQGGGPNPHFALAFGQIMQLNGQFDLALECYERARILADRFSHEPKQCADFKAALDTLEKDLAEQAKWSEAELAERRVDFEQELSAGLALRDQYHQIEAQKIKSGASFDEIDKALDELLASNPEAVSSGDDLLDTLRDPRSDTWEIIYFFPGMILAAGLLAWIASFSKG